MPALSYHFGLHPWDLERLTFDEIHAYVDALHDINREEQAEKAKQL